MSSVFLKDPPSINGPKHFHCGCSIPVRYVLAFLSFLGLVNVYMLRVNLSLAVVVMVDDDAESDGTSIGPYGKVFNWTAAQQGLILGSFYYGYILTQIPGGWLAHRYGAKYVFGIGIVMTALLTLLTPIAASVGVWCLVTVRVIEGIFQGVTFPAMYALWSRWAPPSERSILMTFSLTGQYVGSAVAFPLSAVLCEYGGGWASIFYVFGIVGILWFVLWMVFAYDSPASHPRITQAERMYIESCLSLSTSTAATNRSTPWLHIFTSPAVWAIVVAHFCGNFGFSVLLTTLPTYFRQTLQFNTDKGLLMNGFFSSIPYITETLVVMFLAGPLADVLRAKYFSTQVTRKLFSSLSLCLAALFLILCGYFGTTKWIALTLLTLSVAVSGFQLAGHCINHVDIAPRYSGVLMGITNSAGTIPGIIGPQIAKAIAHSDSSESQELIYEWRNVFIVTAEIYLFGAAIYTILGHGEKQSWANHPAPTQLFAEHGHNHCEQLTCSLSMVASQ